MSELSVQKVTGVVDINLQEPVSFSNSLIIAANTSADAFTVTQNGSGNILVVNNPSNPNSSPFVVDANGNVGIGTSSPTKRLDVSGSIKATNFEGNGAALTGIEAFPANTVMLFVQTTAPVGWTKSTEHNDKALRVVSGSTGSGGSLSFTSTFTSRGVSGSVGSRTAGGTISSTTVSGTVGSTTLTTAQMPSHNHTFAAQALGLGGGGGVFVGGAASSTTNNTGGGGSHNHSFTGDSHSHTFTGTSHNHTFSGDAIDFSVQYVDVIIATKD